jgi:methionyl-tRNA formyltransferase
MELSPVRRPLDLAFMGTPAFAATILDRLIEQGHRVRTVYTQPPRPAGRGHRLQSSPVHLLAAEHGIPVRHPVTLRHQDEQAAFAALRINAAVVAAYGLLLPSAMLRAPQFECINVHASLLPRWRGAAPIQRAILAGDRVTGITIMQMEEGLDTGPILLQEEVPITPDATGASLSAELAVVGGRILLAALDGLAQGRLAPRPQPSQGVSHAPKIRREEGRLDWRRGSVELERRVRALEPWPGAFFEARGERIRVHAAIDLPGPAGGVPGTVLDDRLTVACGEGVLRLLRLQRPGRAPLEAPAFLRGFAIPPGSVLPCPATS